MAESAPNRTTRSKSKHASLRKGLQISRALKAVVEYKNTPKILSLVICPMLLVFAGMNAARLGATSPFVVIRTTITEERAVHSDAAENDANVFSAGGNRSHCGALHAVELARLVRSAAARNNIPPALLLAVIYHESGFNPRAKSPKGALGLMQLMPDVAAQLNVDYPINPEANINAGAKLLGSLLRTYSGDVALALAAYNAGRGNVALAGGIPPFAETKRYIANIMAARDAKPDWEVAESFYRVSSSEVRPVRKDLPAFATGATDGVLRF